MRLHFGVGWLWCEDLTDDYKSKNHNTIIWSSAPNPNIFGIRMSASKDKYYLLKLISGVLEIRHGDSVI